MSSNVRINIQGNSYDMKCDVNQEENLHKAAKLVNEIMSAAKEKQISSEKAAILTALNIASRLINAQEATIQNSSQNNIAEEQISNIINNIHREIQNHVAKGQE